MILAVILAECRSSARSSFQMLVPAMFLLMAAIIIPLTQPGGAAIPAALPQSGLWLAVIFACLTGIENLFIRDGEDGSLCLYAQSECSLVFYALAKLIAHWVTHILPLLCMLPLAALMLAIPAQQWQYDMIVIALASVWIIWIGGVIASILVAQPQSAMLLPFIALPLMIPAVIFAAAGQIWWLSALCAAAFLLAPAGIAAILRGAEENF